MTRPESSEFIPYYSTYIGLIPDGEIIQILNEQINDSISLLKDISDNQGLFRYAPKKWSIKEVLGHMADTERIMAYRLLCFARGEKESLPGFDENSYVLNASFDNQTIEDLVDNFLAVRKSTVHLLKSLNSNSWSQRGTANGGEVTVRAIAYIIAGHELHHRHIIKERYLKANSFPTE